MKEMLYEVRCLKSNEDMIIALAGQFKQLLSHEPSLQILFDITFNTKLPILKLKTLERKLFCQQINQKKALFSFPRCDWL